MHKLLKKIISFLIIFALPCGAFAFGGHGKQPDVNNIQEKLDYVNFCWWQNFNDPILSNYIYQAIENNHSAKEASWKVEEYRQFVKMSFGQELPSLSVGGTYIGAHWPEHITGVKSNVFALPLIAKYEADIFLKNRDKTKSSQKTYKASKFEEKGIYISLATDVATVYLNIIKFDKQISLQEKLVQIKCEKLKREQQRFSRGVISAEALNNSKKDYETSKNTLDELLKAREKSLTELAVLIGDSPENIDCLKRASIDQFDYGCAVPCSLPSDVIFSRPDVLAAETKLEKAKIDVRVARKEFFPTINVTGVYAMSNLGASGFGSWGSTLAGALVGATLDLFKGGTKIANLKIYKSKFEQMFEHYRQTDLTALKEVNDSLYITKQDTQIDENTNTTLKLQTDNYSRSLNKYKNGVISYPELLSQQELLITSEQNKLTSKTNRIIDYFTLYKAVGGKL